MTIADINLEIRALCDADSTSLTDVVLLRRVNQGLEEVIGKIIGADGTWQFDDTNFTDLPIGTTTLVNGQQDYSFDVAMLDIERVEIMNPSGKYELITPLDKSQVGVALTEFTQGGGKPFYYDKNGGSIFLYPIPATGSVTMAAGLKVYFQRTADLFTSAQVTTGTKKPGFASPYHMILAYKAAIPYCMSYKKDRVGLYEKKIMDLEKDMIKFYSRRELDKRKVMTMGNISFR